MVQKGVYPYEYTDDWKRFSETSLPEKEDFYNSLMEDTTDADYKHAKRTWEDFEIKINITIYMFEVIHYS